MVLVIWKERSWQGSEEVIAKRSLLLKRFFAETKTTDVAEKRLVLEEYFNFRKQEEDTVVTFLSLLFCASFDFKESVMDFLEHTQHIKELSARIALLEEI